MCAALEGYWRSDSDRRESAMAMVADEYRRSRRNVGDRGEMLRDQAELMWRRRCAVK